MTPAPTLSELNREAFELLFKQMGPARALRFLQQFPHARKEYREIKDEVFEGLSVQAIAGLIEQADVD